MSFSKGLTKSAVSREWARQKVLGGLLSRAKINPKSSFAKELKFHYGPIKKDASLPRLNNSKSTKGFIHRLSAVTKGHPERALKEVEAIADANKVGQQ